MTLHNLVAPDRNERGFTVIELLIGIVVTGIIGTALAGLIYQVTSVYARVTNRVTVNNQVSGAVQWITSDSQMAQQITVGNETGPDLRVTFIQNGWDSSVYNITYTITGENQLLRQYIKTGADGEIEETNAIIVARYIDTGNTTCSFNSIDPNDDAFGVLECKITARIEGFMGQSATAQVQVITRFFL